MPAPSQRYVCQNCGTVSLRWSGQCSGCQNWNTIIEEVIPTQTPGSGNQKKSQKNSSLQAITLDTHISPPPRTSTQIQEFDRVMGGGIVSGSVSLIGGEPGVGKSTLILQIASLISHQLPTLYVSGEEAIDQIALRARRLGFQDTPQLQAVAATNVNDILSLVSKPHSPQLLIIDSVQTMFVNGIESAPGTVSQVRAVAQILISFAKKSGCALIMIGHMTKDGSLAGPRVLEHMVDTVLYIEGEKGHHFRILRSSKNRFGATDEIGVFDMTEKGLQQVPNPSELFLSARQKNVPGTAVFAGMEGSRPVLVEIQALVAPSPFSAPRRAVVGWDSNRLAMILAILETRAGYLLSSSDVYLNVVGGLRISETAADLAACSALVSALIGKPLPDNTIIFGETGLTGEVRTVSHTDTRLREASKLGFSNALIPKQKKSSHINISTTFAQNINTLQELFS